MKNGLHLEAAGSNELEKTYLKSEKHSVLSDHDGFFGYFCTRTNRLFVNRVDSQHFFSGFTYSPVTLRGLNNVRVAKR